MKKDNLPLGIPENEMKLKTKMWIDYYIGSFLHVMLKPIVMLFSRIIGRRHEFSNPRRIVFLKLLGGGSLIIAYPTLLGIKRHFPEAKLIAVSTPGVASFATLTGLFDECIVIRDGSIFVLIVDVLRLCYRLIFVDIFIDMEVHSRLSAVLGILMFARNRVGFYTEVSFWRKNIFTHLIFLNKYSGIYYFYDQLANLLGAPIPSYAESSQIFKTMLGANAAPREKVGLRRIGVAVGCSQLGQERMLNHLEWLAILREKQSEMSDVEFHFLGAGEEKKFVDSLVGIAGTGLHLLNQCGLFSLRESVELLAQLDELICIDSSLLHIARLLGIGTTSYWGPTDPATRLRPGLAKDIIHYSKLPCSPCVHIAAEVPCRGVSLCIRFLFESASGDVNPLWLA